MQISNDGFLLRQYLILSFIFIRLEAEERKLIKLIANKGDLAAKLSHKFFDLNVRFVHLDADIDEVVFRKKWVLIRWFDV